MSSPEVSPLPNPEQAMIASTVTAILVRHSLRDPATLTPMDRLEDLGLDSMAMVEAVFAIEEAFDIAVPFSPQDEDPGAAFDTSTVGSVIAAVAALVAAKASLAP